MMCIAWMCWHAHKQQECASEMAPRAAGGRCRDGGQRTAAVAGQPRAPTLHYAHIRALNRSKTPRARTLAFENAVPLAPAPLGPGGGHVLRRRRRRCALGPAQRPAGRLHRGRAPRAYKPDSGGVERGGSDAPLEPPALCRVHRHRLPLWQEHGSRQDVQDRREAAREGDRRDKDDRGGQHLHACRLPRKRSRVRPTDRQPTANRLPPSPVPHSRPRRSSWACRPPQTTPQRSAPRAPAACLPASLPCCSSAQRRPPPAPRRPAQRRRRQRPPRAPREQLAPRSAPTDGRARRGRATPPAVPGRQGSACRQAAPTW